MALGYMKGDPDELLRTQGTNCSNRDTILRSPDGNHLAKVATNSTHRQMTVMGIGPFLGGTRAAPIHGRKGLNPTRDYRAPYTYVRHDSWLRNSNISSKSNGRNGSRGSYSFRDKGPQSFS